MSCWKRYGSAGAEPIPRTGHLTVGVAPVRITFDVPADPAYAGRVATVLSDVYLRKYAYIGAAMVAVGAIGAFIGHAHGPVLSFFTTMIVVGVLSMLFPVWMGYSTRRRSTGLAVDGAYDI